jgi:hypothetical protein
MEQSNKNGKKSYTAPRIVVLGDIEAITMGTHDGDFTDAAFPEMTPRRLLTFS